MKNFYVIVAFVMLGMVQGFSQSCTPNAATGTPGVTPATAQLPCAERGMPYSTTIYVENFDQYVISAGTVHVDSLRVDSITNLPWGLTLAMNPTNGVLHARQTGCLNISGTTYDSVGQYPAYIYATVWAHLTTAFGSTTLGPFQGRADDLIAQISQLAGQTIPVNFNYWIRVKNICETGCFALDTTGATNRVAGVNVPAVPDLFVPSISGATGACTGDSVWVKASFCGTSAANPTYLWSTGATTDSIKVAAPGTVSVTMTGSSGHVDSISRTVQGLSLPIASDSLVASDSVSLTVLNNSVGNSSKVYLIDSVSGAVVDSLVGSGQFFHSFTANGTYYVYTVSNNGCGSDTTASRTFRITSFHVIGVNNINNIGALVSIYPNPSNGEVNLKIFSAVTSTETYSVKIYNVQGQEVYTQSFTGNINKAIDLSYLGAGVYLAHINSANLSTVQRLIIK